jgi:aconitate hydratase
MGVLPLVFTGGDNAQALDLDGTESFDLLGLDDLAVGENMITMRIGRAGRAPRELKVALHLDAEQEIRYLRHGGVLPYVVRKMAFADARA